MTYNIRTPREIAKMESSLIDRLDDKTEIPRLFQWIGNRVNKVRREIEE